MNADKEASMFELAKYPEIVQTQFLDPILPWEVVFEAAMDAGITDRDMAADLIFFKNHPERMRGGSGTALNRSERGFRDLVKEWEGWRDSVVEPRLADRVSWHGRRFTPLGLDNERIIQLEKLIRAHARRWDPPRFRRAVRALSSTEQEVVAYLLTIWPTLLRNKVVAEMFAIISKLSMETDGIESKRARFPMARGKKLMEELIFRSERMPAGNKCLNFIANEALGIFSSRNLYQRRQGSARARYDEVGAYRAQQDLLHGRSLSLLAAELRLEGLVAPMHYAKWNGRRGRKLAYKPSPGKFMDRLTQNPGWYFFLSGVVSYHTILVGVRATKTSKVFQIIDDNGAKKRMSLAEIQAWYDDWFIKGAGSRVWMIYRP
jgi:hypothetical protein